MLIHTSSKSLDHIFDLSNLKLKMNKPNIYIFNPTCELAVANGSFSYMPPLLLQEMEKDLSILPYIYANSNDFVLTENPPSDEFKQTLKDAGFKLPRFCNHTELSMQADSGLNSLHPWGWSPAAHFNLNKYKERCSDEFKNSPVYDWQPKHKSLYERATSLGLLSDILAKNKTSWMVDRQKTGTIVSDIPAIEDILKVHQSVVLKAPLSSSGRGIQIIRTGALNQSNRQWISGVLKQQKYLIAEPYLEKKLDLSFQFRIDKTNIEYLGISVFETNSNGQYKGTFIRPEFNQILPEADVRILNEMIKATANRIKNSLYESDYFRFYQGFLGIDTMIFNDHDQLKMQPCIEVNCRMNMGILSKYLEYKIHPGSSGIFNLFTGKPGDYKKFVSGQLKTNPLCIKDGKIYSGFLPLTEPDANKKFGAYTICGVAK